MKWVFCFSSYNEIHNPFFWENIHRIKASGLSYQIVDGGSTDGTIDQLTKFNFEFEVLPLSFRSQRYNLAAQKAEYELTHHKIKVMNILLIFVHPRSKLPQAFDDLSIALLQQNQKLDRTSNFLWGAWKHSFDQKNFFYQFTSWYSNTVRGRWRSIYYLDHCLFCSMGLFNQVGQFDAVPIFEDTLLSYKLRKIKTPLLLNSYVITSAIRFKKNGFFIQSFKNLVAKTLFFLNFSKSQISAYYEKKIDLN